MNKIQGSLLGVAIGDALGAPVEVWSAEKIKALYGKITKYHQPRDHKYLDDNRPLGKTTDDWQLTAATIKALIAANGFTLPSQARQHVIAMKESTEGWGKTTRENVARLEAATDYVAPYQADRGTGNGVCMKIAPLAIWDYFRSLPENALEDYARLTHNTRLAVSSGCVFVKAIQYCLSKKPGEFNRGEFIDTLIKEAKRVEAIESIPESSSPEHQFSWALEHLVGIERQSDEQIIRLFGGGCYVFESLPFSLAFFLKNPESIDAMYDVISAGGDTDSNGSMVAALLGAYHGDKIFPKELISGLHGADEIQDLISEFSLRVQ